MCSSPAVFIGVPHPRFLRIAVHSFMCFHRLLLQLRRRGWRCDHPPATAAAAPAALPLLLLVLVLLLVPVVLVQPLLQRLAEQHDVLRHGLYPLGLRSAFGRWYEPFEHAVRGGMQRHKHMAHDANN